MLILAFFLRTKILPVYVSVYRIAGNFSGFLFPLLLRFYINPRTINPQSESGLGGLVSNFAMAS